MADISMMIPFSELVEKFGVKPNGIIHLGAHEGQELEDYLKFNVPNVVWIEANPAIFEKLQSRIEPYPNHRAFQFAVHEKDKDFVELHVMENTMSSSILYPKKHLEFYPHVPVTKNIRVPTRTLDSFFEEEQITAEDYNFLNMDIQGAELLALKGAKNSLKNFDYVYTEVNDDYLFENCCLTKELDSFLGQEGFIRTVTRMTKDKWGDALYVRQNSIRT